MPVVLKKCQYLFVVLRDLNSSKKAFFPNLESPWVFWLQYEWSRQDKTSAHLFQASFWYPNKMHLSLVTTIAQLTWLWLALLPTISAQAQVNFTNEEVTSILNSITRGDRYDRRIRPGYGGPPTVVNVTIYVLSISSVSEINMDFTMDFYMEQSWQDARVRFDHPRIKQVKAGSEYLRQRLWLPETFFANGKEGKFHKATVTNENVRIDADGTVFWKVRLIVTAHCRMDLHLYPFDTQVCTLEAENYNYNVWELVYYWGRKGHQLDPVHFHNVSLPQHKILGYRTSTAGHETNGGFGSVSCSIVLSRSIVYFLVRIYIPCALIVIISWLPLWIDKNARLERVAIGISTVLALSTFISSIDDDLPKISYLTAIDIYLFACFVMVFGAVIENSASGMGERLLLNKVLGAHAARANEVDTTTWGWKPPRILRSPNVTRAEHISVDMRRVEKGFDKATCHTKKAKSLSKFIFPAGFIGFNLVYLVTYLSLTIIHAVEYSPMIKR